MTEGPKGPFDNWIEDSAVLDKEPDKKERPITPPDDSGEEQPEADSEGKIKAWSKWLNNFIWGLGYAWEIDGRYLKDQGVKTLDRGLDRAGEAAGSIAGSIKEKGKQAGGKIKAKGKGVKRGVRAAPRKAIGYWGCLLPLIPIACFAVWQIRGLGREMDSESWLGSLEKVVEAGGEVFSGSMTIAEAIDYAANGADGELAAFRSGVIDLDLLDPWDDASVWKVVGGGGALAPFVGERDGYIDKLFGEDVKSGSMTKDDLTALLWRAKDKDLMTADEVLFYLIRFEYGDDGEGFINLVKRLDRLSTEERELELRKLQSGGDRGSFGQTGLSRREVVNRQRGQKDAMRVAARQARQKRWS